MKWMRMTKLAYLGFFTALSVLIFLSVFAVISFKQNNENDHWVKHTYRVLQTSNLLMSALKDAETAQRGYIITGDAKYLTQVTASIVQKDSLLGHLLYGTRENPLQRKRVLAIAQLIQKKYSFSATVIAERNIEGLDKAIQRINTGSGKVLMDQLREQFKAFDQEETRLLQIRSLKKDQTFRTIKIVLFVGILFIVFVLLLTFFSLMKQIRHRKRNEEALFIQNDWFTQTLISLGDGVITTDINGLITMINKAACTITGWTMYEAIGEPLEEVFHIINPVTGERTKNPALAALEKKSVVLLEENTMLVRKDGTRIYIDDSGAPIHKRDGEMIGAVLIFRDISEKKTAIEERDLFYKISVDMIGIAGVDGFFKNINPAFQKILGYTEEEFLSRSYLDYIHPEDIVSTVDEVNRLASGHTSTDFVNRYLCKNGDYKWIEWNVTPVGTLLYSTGRDITERKIAAEALAATYSKFYQVLESTPVSIIITDTITRKITYVNDSFCAMTGFDKSEIIGNSSIELKLIDKEESNRIITTLLHAGGHKKNMETQLTTKDGRKIDVIFSIEKMEIDGNLSYIGSFIDITERKRAENDILRMNQSLEKRVEKRTVEIEKQKRFTDEILNKIPTEIAVYDAKEHYLYVNPEAIESAEEREWIIGKTDFDYCAKKGLDPRIAERRHDSFSIVKKNKFTEWIDEIPTEAGTIKYMLRIMHALEGNKKFILTGYDITDLKVAEQKNQEYTTSLEEMMFITSHKMRHPVTQIMGIETLLDYAMSQEELEKVIGYIKDAINSLDTYTHQLTMFIHNSKKNNTK
jgi:PAS domain S-box-containing protein